MIAPIRSLLWTMLLLAAALPMGGCLYAVYRDEPQWFLPASDGLYDRQVIDVATPTDDHVVELRVVGMRTVESGAHIDIMFSGPKAEEVARQWARQFGPYQPSDYPDGYFMVIPKDNSNAVQLVRLERKFHSVMIVPPFALVNAIEPGAVAVKIGGLPAKWLVGLPVRVEDGLPPGTYRVAVGGLIKQLETPDARATPRWTADEFVVTTTVDSQLRTPFRD